MTKTDKKEVILTFAAEEAGWLIRKLRLVAIAEKDKSVTCAPNSHAQNSAISDHFMATFLIERIESKL